MDTLLTKFIETANVIKEYKYDLKNEKLTLVTEKMNESVLNEILNSNSSVAQVLMLRKAVC